MEKNDRMKKQIYFVLMEIFFIFLVPAVVAVLFGKWAMTKYNYSSGVILYALFFAFAGSWFYLLSQFQRLHNQFEHLSTPEHPEDNIIEEKK